MAVVQFRLATLSEALPPEIPSYLLLDVASVDAGQLQRDAASPIWARLLRPIQDAGLPPLQARRCQTLLSMVRLSAGQYLKPEEGAFLEQHLAIRTEGAELHRAGAQAWVRVYCAHTGQWRFTHPFRWPVDSAALSLRRQGLAR